MATGPDQARVNDMLIASITSDPGQASENFSCVEDACEGLQFKGLSKSSKAIDGHRRLRKAPFEGLQSAFRVL